MKCIFVGYPIEHEGYVFRFWNPKTKRIILSRDFRWTRKLWNDKEPMQDQLELMYSKPRVIEIGSAVDIEIEDRGNTEEEIEQIEEGNDNEDEEGSENEEEIIEPRWERGRNLRDLSGLHRCMVGAVVSDYNEPKTVKEA